MASIDEAIIQLAEAGEKLWDEFKAKRDDFTRKTAKLMHLHLLTTDDCGKRDDIVALDPCKITIITDGSISGIALQKILLDDYKLQLELASEQRIIAIVTYADSVEGFERFADALLEIDNRIERGDYVMAQFFTQASSCEGDRRDLYAPCIPGQV